MRKLVVGIIVVLALAVAVPLVAAADSPTTLQILGEEIGAIIQAFNVAVNGILDAGKQAYCAELNKLCS